MGVETEGNAKLSRTELKLELGLSLAITVYVVVTLKWKNSFYLFNI